MKNENKKTMYIAICALILAVIGISIAYAALSTNLNIQSASITQNALNWDVHFQSGTVTPTSSGTSSTGRSCGNATVNATTVSTAATTLSKPGDTCTYALKVQNTGDIDANLATITPTAPNSTSCTTIDGANMVCGNITYKLTTDQNGQNLLTTNRTLAKTNGVLDLYLVITYSGTETNTTPVTHNGGSFTLVYNQV